MKTETEIETAIEPMRTRVALHPFLAGMNRKQLALLTDCAMPVHFKQGQTIFREGEMANRFYLIETGKVLLESSDGFDNPVPSKQSALETCLAGRGCFHRTLGVSQAALRSQLQPSFSMERFCANTVSATIRLATNCSNAWHQS